MSNIKSKKEIPDAPYYVCSTDTFMSGWGKAEGLINRLIFPCRDYDEALVVAQNATDRRDQKQVRINSQKPNVYKKKYWQVKTRFDCPTWFQTNRPFKK